MHKKILNLHNCGYFIHEYPGLRLESYFTAQGNKIATNLEDTQVIKEHGGYIMGSYYCMNVLCFKCLLDYP